MGTWRWVENIPSPDVYILRESVLDRIDGKFFGEPRAEEYFTVGELKQRCIIGVYAWEERKQEAQE